MKKRFVVVGLGNFGSSVATALYLGGNEVIAVDTRPELVDRIADDVSRAVVADGTQREALERAGAEQADGGIVSTGDNLTASILSALALQDLKVEELFVKVTSVEHRRVMLRLGVHETIFPEQESGNNLARRLMGHGVLNYFQMGQGYSMREIVVPPAWQGRSLRAIGMRQEYGVHAVGVHDQLRGLMAIPPDPDRPLTLSDTLLVAGSDEAFARLKLG